jgi:NAD-dependent DNA ligase
MPSDAEASNNGKYHGDSQTLLGVELEPESDPEPELKPEPVTCYVCGQALCGSQKSLQIYCPQMAICPYNLHLGISLN